MIGAAAQRAPHIKATPVSTDTSTTGAQLHGQPSLFKCTCEEAGRRTACPPTVRGQTCMRGYTCMGVLPSLSPVDFRTLSMEQKGPAIRNGASQSGGRWRRAVQVPLIPWDWLIPRGATSNIQQPEPRRFSFDCFITLLHLRRLRRPQLRAAPLPFHYSSAAPAKHESTGPPRRSDGACHLRRAASH